ncbi:MAG: methyltransferase family protein [Promethearchaeota archaeon]
MKLKGLNKFREKIPLFQGRKIVILPLFFLSVLTLILLFQFMFYFLTVIPLTGILIPLKPWFPVIGLIITAFIGLFLVYLMWGRRDTLKRKYGALSYQKIFLFGLSGVVVMFSIVEQAIFPFYLGINSFLTELPYIFYTISLISFIPVIGIFLDFIFFILGIFICILALIMVYRAINTFGFDYMAVVYLYFPEESEIQNNEIYSVLRHPTYSALIMLCLGGIFIHLNFYSILNFLIFLLVMYIHVHFVEEKELITRFGDSYKEFRKNVPAFFVHPNKWKNFFKFIIGKL